MAGLTGAIGLPLATKGGPLKGAAVGSVLSGTNTAFNNWYYAESNNVFYSALAGAGASVVAPYAGQMIVKGTNGLLGNPLMHIPVQGSVQPIRVYRDPAFWATVPSRAGSVGAAIVGNSPSFMDLGNGK